MVKTNEQLQQAFDLLKASEGGLEGTQETLKMRNILGTLKKLITKRGGDVKAGMDEPGSELLKEVLTTINLWDAN